MSGAVTRKRRGEESSRPKMDRINKKRKKQLSTYHSDSDSVEGDSGSDDDFQAVDLLDSDNDALNDDALVDDGDSSDNGGRDSDSDDSLDSLKDDSVPRRKQANSTKTPKAAKTARGEKKSPASDAPKQYQNGNEGSDDDQEDEDEDEDGSAASADDGEGTTSGARAKSKRNDPSTFATSLQKILGTKLSTTRRVDPVLSRSAEARDASRQGVDAALEDKARRQMRLEKRAAMDKGRVKDVLIATNRLATLGGGADDADAGTAQETTATILATEKRLRKVAQRGVVQLFNAVRAAQVKAAQAKRLAKTEGILGMDKREAKVTEMSRKGFLDLIASGGGGLKKSGLEEA